MLNTFSETESTPPFLTLVLGLGSFYGHDIAGLHVLEKLKNSPLANDSNISLISCYSEADVLEAIARHGKTIKNIFLIDAVYDASFRQIPAEKNLLEQFDETELSDSPFFQTSHHLSLSDTFKLARMLYLRDEASIRILGIHLKNDKSFEYDEALLDHIFQMLDAHNVTMRL